jgi:hypothetical protein
VPADGHTAKEIFMDGKRIAIGALVALAILLGGLVAGGLRDRAAYGQGGVFASYLAVAPEVREDYVNFVILDTNTQRAVVYDVAPPKHEMTLTQGIALDRDFQRKRP